MNSLLQTLFMTPELRRQLYMWQYNPDKHGPEADCIPLQLQILFSKLQLSSAWYEDTSALTQSFGWDLGESFQQHDVQEFCRVLFDAIERSVTGTPQQNLINELYQGKLTDYVKCVNCAIESSREDLFLDLSLTVRNEFDKVYSDSVEKALDNYLKPELLSGDNQYACSHCQSKQDAVKGLKLCSLPYILTLQLKRFDLDYSTMQRVKLNDHVSFPRILNMNSYIGDQFANRIQTSFEHVDAEAEEIEPAQPQIKRFVPASIETLELDRTKSSGYITLLCDDDKEPIKPDFLVSKRHQDILAEQRQQERERHVQAYFREGPHVYELFSILIHSGSASSGHYYAYIKSFERDQWFEFNDSTVKPIKDSAIKDVFGGTRRDMLGDSYGANAYLLCYRRIEQANVNSVSSAEVPEHARKAVEEARLKEAQETLARAERYACILVKVFYGQKEKSLEVKPELTINEFKIKAIELFGVTSAAEDVRVRAYSSYSDIMQDVYAEDKSLSDSNIYNYKTLTLETKDSGADWPTYDPNAITVKVYVWDDALAAQPNLGLDSKLSPPVKVQISKLATVTEMTQIFARRFGIEAEGQKVLKKSYIGATNHIEVVNSEANSTSSMLYARVYEGSILYVEQCQDLTDKSKWVEELEKEARRYKVKFNDPDVESAFVGQVDFTRQVSLDCGQTLAVLKEVIGNELHLHLDRFLMRRGSKHGVELKDLTMKLSQANLLSGSVVFIEKGTPTCPDDCRLQVHLAEIPKHPRLDGTCYNFYELFEIPINSAADVLTAKQAICAAANLIYPSLSLTPQLIRLRERSSERLCKAMIDSEILKSFTLYDRKQIAVQVLSEPEEAKASDLIVLVRRWFPETWELSEPIELFFDKYSSVHAFFVKLSTLYEIPVRSR
jgi:ubiquitin C-terminal hydrolase